MLSNCFVQVLLAILDLVDDTKLVTKVCVYVYLESCTFCYIFISSCVAISLYLVNQIPDYLEYCRLSSRN
jgi:hypothetical protein